MDDVTMKIEELQKLVSDLEGELLLSVALGDDFQIASVGSSGGMMINFIILEEFIKSNLKPENCDCPGCQLARSFLEKEEPSEESEVKRPKININIDSMMAAQSIEEVLLKTFFGGGSRENNQD